MMCCVITRYHPMVGCDLHATWPTMPLPAPVPMGPHFVAAVSRVGPWWMAEPNRSTMVETAAGQPLSKVFDIGMFIPHLGPNHPLLLVILLLTSSSQGHFGVSSVEIQVNAGKGPVAVALALVVNPQLNCNDRMFFPIPLPTGILITPNTVVAGLTLGDLLAGLLSMVITSAVTAVIGLALNKIAGPVVKWVGGRFVNLSHSLLGRIVMRMPDRYFRVFFQGTLIGAILAKRFGPHADALFGMLLGWSVGSPTGYAFPFAPLPGVLENLFPSVQQPDTSAIGPIQGLTDTLGKGVDGWANQWGLNDYFNDVALIPTFPVAMPVPASAVTGPLSAMQGPLDVGTAVADPVANFVEPVGDALQHIFTGKHD